jgi:hypothetical protein
MKHCSTSHTCSTRSIHDSPRRPRHACASNAHAQRAVAVRRASATGAAPRGWGRPPVRSALWLLLAARPCGCSAAQVARQPTAGAARERRGSLQRRGGLDVARWLSAERERASLGACGHAASLRAPRCAGPRRVCARAGRCTQVRPLCATSRRPFAYSSPCSQTRALPRRRAPGSRRPLPERAAGQPYLLRHRAGLGAGADAQGACGRCTA